MPVVRERKTRSLGTNGKADSKTPERYEEAKSIAWKGDWRAQGCC